MTFRRYKLEGRTPVPVEDSLDWARWFEKADPIVAVDHVAGIRISTVFLGTDHNFTFAGPPLLFETMVFGGALDQEQERYSTWEEAEAGHRAMVQRVRESIQ